MSTITVANSSQLQNALSTAKAGDTIALKSGSYGDVVIKDAKFADHVTITSADGANGAVFDSITLEGTSNIRIDGVHVDSSGGKFGIWVSNSNNIEIVNSEVHGPEDAPHPIDDLSFGIAVRGNSSDIVIANNYVHHAVNGIAHFGTKNFEVSENNVNYVGADAFKFANVHYGLIENNTGPTHFHPKPDAHADFMQFQGLPSSHLEIIGNVLMLQNRFDMQGIFMGGEGGHNNLNISQNIIYTQMANGISIKDGIGSTIEVTYNTLVNALQDERPVTRINVASEANTDYNIQSKKIGALEGNNINMQHLDEGGAFHYSDLFVNAESGPGIALEDLLPVQGSLAESYGAISRLMELLDGVDMVPTPTQPVAPEPEVTIDPEPTPEPEPESTPSEEPTAGPTSEPESAPQELEEGFLYHLHGDTQIASAADVVEVAPEALMDAASVTMALTFNADSIEGRHGIISKDASGGGDHFTAYLDGGTLVVRFQDGDLEKSFTVGGLQSGVDYDLQLCMGEGEVLAMLDGNVFGQAAFGTSWSQNGEYLQVGANGWGSVSGESGFTHVFDGTITDVVILDGYQLPQSPTARISCFDTSAPEPAPTVSPDANLEALFVLDGSREFTSRKDVFEFAHESAWEVPEATVALSFNSDNVKGTSGLISKDASGLGGGHHFSAYIKDGTLFIRFQDGTESATLKYSGITANTDYDLQIRFANGEVSATIDGELIGSVEFATSLAANAEFLQVGALGWASDAGDDGFRSVFDGTISDVAIFDELLTVQEVDTYFL